MARERTEASAGRSGQGAYKAEGGSGKGSGLKKLLLLLLGLLVLVLLVVLLISLLGGDDDDKASGGSMSTGGGSGQLSAGGATLLPPPSAGLSGQAGKGATGKSLSVQSVNGNEGFFVGSSVTERVYIEWGGDVGEDESSRFQPKKGQKVNLTGPVQAADPPTLAKLKLAPSDAKLVRSQGGFVNADRVSASK